MLKIISLVFSLVQLIVVVVLIAEGGGLRRLWLTALLLVTPIVYLMYPFFAHDGTYSWFSLYTTRKKLEEQKKIERLRIP